MMTRQKAQELAVLQTPQVNGKEQHHVFSFRHTSEKDERRDVENEAENDSDDAADDDEESDADEDGGSSLLAVAAQVRRASVAGMAEAQLGQMADVEAALAGGNGID